MEPPNALPKWVKKSRTTLKQSQEWQTFMMSLYDIVHHQMKESGVGSFSDLSPPERKLLLQRAFQALKTSESYHKLMELASDSLDNSLSYEASNLSLLKSQSKTRIQILQNESHKAVSSLLQRWPDERTSLQMCLNSIVPSGIRYVLWKSFLKNPKAREDYLKLVASDPKKLVSDSDFEISLKCQNLLESVPTLRSISSKKATCSVMRHLLSYRQMRTKKNLIETDYLLSVPPVICTLSAFNTNNSLSPQKPLTTEALATLVEEFSVFMDKRPDYMMSKQGPSLIDLSEKTGVILRKINLKLCNTMENYHVGQRQLTRASPTSELQIVLSKLLHSVLRSMFVGFLPLDSVLHAWNIVVLGFDQPQYDPVPYLCASILLVLQEELMNCRTLKAAETALVRGCKGIDESRLAQAMSEYGFEKTLQENLSALQESQFPVFHPAPESNMPPWKHWYSSKLISYLQEEKWQSKQKAEAVIDDDAAKPSSSASGSSKAGQNQVWLLEQAKQELEEEVENLKEERDALLEGLQEERRTRVDVQEYADEEIERLQRQIIGLQSLPDERVVASPVIKSPAYHQPTRDIKAPPPSVVSSRSKVVSPPAAKHQAPVSPEIEKQLEPEPVPETEPTPAVPEAKSTKDDSEERAIKVTTDLLAKMMEGINMLAQGSGKTRKELDQFSKKDIDKFHVALNKAQISIFGKSMSDDDLERLPTPERDEKMTKVREETVKRLFNIK